MLVSNEELVNLKLKTIPVPLLKQLCLNLSLPGKGNGSALIASLISAPEDKIDGFIKSEYSKLVLERQNIISDVELKEELSKVNNISWGVVQGKLDGKVQREYVRVFAKYQDLLDGVTKTFFPDVLNYVTASWYNHWTTVLIEDHIAKHSRIIPTIKKVAETDIFFDGQPFDLKITYLPRGYDSNAALANPKDLIIWMYENQGEERFGSNNRLFIILLDQENPSESWKLKRDFEKVFNSIDLFFNESKVTSDDEITFNFKGTTYKTISKIHFITI